MTEMLPLLEVGLATGAGRETTTGRRGWTCGGTRKFYGPKGRDQNIPELTRKGEPEWIAMFDLDQESRDQFTWCSCWPGLGLEDERVKFALDGEDGEDERVKFALEGHRARPPGSEASVRPILSYGRSAKMDPPCAPHLAVWHCWQDSALCSRVWGCRPACVSAKVECSCADRQGK